MRFRTISLLTAGVLLSCSGSGGASWESVDEADFASSRIEGDVRDLRRDLEECEFNQIMLSGALDELEARISEVEDRIEEQRGW